MDLSFSLIINSVPESLALREPSADLLVGILIFLAFVTIAISNFLRPNIYPALLVANSKIQGVQTYLRESLPLMKFSSLLLIINYLLTGGAITYLLLRDVPIHYSLKLTLVGLVPLCILVWNLGSMLSVAWLSGETHVFREPLALKMIGAQLLGVIYFGCALVWMLNARYDGLFLQIVWWLFVGESLFRWLKSIISVSRRGVDWYYIILYFCTLEILPLSVTYYLVSGNFV